MSLIAVIDVSQELATVVTGEVSNRGEITLHSYQSLPLTAPVVVDGGDEGTEEGAYEAVGKAGCKLPSITEGHTVVATLSPRRVLYHNVDLPFTDVKKIESVLPLHLQDHLPFEVEGFIVDSNVVRRGDGGESQVLAALVPEADVERTLASLAPYEVDPRVLTTKAGAIAELRHLFPEELQGTFALCTEGADVLSIAIFRDGKPVALREVFGVGQAPEARAQAILTTVAGTEKTLGFNLEQVIGVGCSPRTLEALSRSELSVIELRLDGAVQGEEMLPVSVNTVAWAVGLLAGDLAARPIVNFRRGKYAYRARYDKLLQPLREELNYILFAVGAVVLFLFAALYHGSKTSSELDERILALTREVSPAETPPSGRELSFVQGKLDEIENQLRALGSLASLSPLGALREVAETLPPGTELESVSIGNSRITMTGTVSDIPAVGRLNGVFERKADRFCDVKVDSKGKSSGSSRVGFIAEIGMCE